MSATALLHHVVLHMLASGRDLVGTRSGKAISQSVVYAEDDADDALLMPQLHHCL